MVVRNITRNATAIVILSGILWGFYWIPVRALAEQGLSGGIGTAAITLGGALTLLVTLVGQRPEGANVRASALGLTMLGGAGFALYSIGFLYGRVALVVLLFFLTPVWTTLIVRYLLGVRTPLFRLMAIGVGLTGLILMLGTGVNIPMPRNTGEWFGLISGLLWSVATVGLRRSTPLPPVLAGFAFSVGALATSLAVTLVLTVPVVNWSVGSLALAFLTGALWWGGAIVALLWATSRLDPARVGILLMSEVLVGACSAAVIAGESLSLMEIAGGGLVLLAGVIEVWPSKPNRRAA